jgi:flagellar hook-length control protein FliK
MPSTINLTTTKIELTTVTLSHENFEAGAADDFQRFLDRVEATKQEISKQSGQVSEEIKQARLELEEGLNSRRQRLDDELKKARARLDEIKDEAGKAEEITSFAADRIDDQTALRAVVVVGSILPQSYKNQLGSALMASGNEKNGLNGWILAGGGRPTGLLRDTLESLGGLGSRFNLNRDALSDLEGILAESGLEAERISELMAGLTAGPLTLDRVLMTAAKADALASAEGLGAGIMVDGFTLTATPAGLNSLGQFFLSLGLSMESVKAATSSIAPGQSLTSFDLANMISAGGEILAPCLTEGDLTSLTAAFKSMGADQNILQQLNALLNQSSPTLNDLTGLLAFMEQPKPLTPDASASVKSVQNLLANTALDGTLVKAPLFNEIVLKLANLGDREISSDFVRLSPALQALRGGVSGLKDAQSEFGQGGGQNNFSDSREQATNSAQAISGDGTGKGTGAEVKSGLFGEALSYSAGETLAKQIEQKLVYSARRGIQRLKINLAPESLGQLDIELKVEKEKLTAHIQAETVEAFEALEKELTSLKESLAQAGLELAMTISYGNGGEGASTYARSGGRSSAINQSTADDTEASETASISNGEEYADGIRLFDKVV